MNAQTKGVNVLAIMDEAAGKLVRSPNPAIAAHSTAVGEARAAVAELIELGRAVEQADRDGTLTDELMGCFGAALVRCGVEQ